MTATTRRTTKQRQAIAAAMQGTEEFLSAQTLHQRLRQAGDLIGLATVYRNLQAMTQDGEVDVVRTEDGEALYRACSTGHHHHLVCRVCGTTAEVEGEAVERWANRVSQAHGFVDVDHTVELFGTCGACATRS